MNTASFEEKLINKIQIEGFRHGALLSVRGIIYKIHTVQDYSLYTQLVMLPEPGLVLCLKLKRGRK